MKEYKLTVTRSDYSGYGTRFTEESRIRERDRRNKAIELLNRLNREQWAKEQVAKIKVTPISKFRHYFNKLQFTIKRFLIKETPIPPSVAGRRFHKFK